MGKTRDPFKKIRDTKGTFQGKMGSIKDRNGMDLTEAEDIKKRWPEDEMVKQHHQLNGHEFEQTSGDSEGQQSLLQRVRQDLAVEQ